MNPNTQIERSKAQQTYDVAVSTALALASVLLLAFAIGAF